MPNVTGGDVKTWKSHIVQLTVLVKHFLLKFTHGEIIQDQSHRRDTVLGLFIIMACTGGYISYDVLSDLRPLLMAEKAWLAKTYFISLMMVFAGIISLVTWDHMMLDEKDFKNLFHLPIKSGILAAAKYISNFAFVAFITAAFGLPATIVFTGYLYNSLAVNPFYFAAVFLVTLLTANLSIFLFFSFFRSFLAFFLKGRVFRIAQLFLQSIFLVGFMSVFTWLPLLYNSLEELKNTGSPVLYRYPPLWFAGFSERMTGNNDILFGTHTNQVLLLFALLFLLNLAFGASAYKKSLRGDWGGGAKSRKPLRPPGGITGLWYSFFLKNSMQRAIFHFVSILLRRNWQYAAHLVIYAVLPFGFVLSRLIYLYSDKQDRLFQTLNGDLLSIPLTIVFPLVAGFRSIVLHPSNPAANWVFKISDTTVDRDHYHSGLKKAFIVFVLCPLVLVFFVFYYYIWGDALAIMHCVFVFPPALLLLELFFFNYRKIPFASSYSGGKGNLKLWWPLYLGGFAAFVIGFTRLELFLFGVGWWALIAFCVFLAGLHWLIRRIRRSRYRGFEFVFDADAETEDGFR